MEGTEKCSNEAVHLFYYTQHFHLSQYHYNFKYLKEIVRRKLKPSAQKCRANII